MSADVRIEHATRSSRIGVVAIAFLAVALAAAPLWAGRQELRLLAEIFGYVALASLWNLLAGYAGLVSVGQQAYVGLGAYLLFALTMLLDIHPLLALPMVGVMAAIVAVPVAGLMFRLRGHYFAIATLGLNEATKALVNNLTDLTGGGMGLSLPLPPGEATSSAALFFYAFYGLMIGAALITYWLRHSRLGLACRAIRSAEEAAACSGVNTTACKTLIWMISAGLTGVAGGIYAYWISYIEPGVVFNMAIAVKAFVIFLLGGAGTLLGPIFGAVFVELVSTTIWSHFLNYHLGILGVIIVLAAIFTPDGIAAFLRKRLAAAGLLPSRN